MDIDRNLLHESFCVLAVYSACSDIRIRGWAMTENETTREAISLLQDLGLQEYEARCFMALNRLPSGTAKEIHEISEVPRTRVYDAIRVLESQGLVEVQHTSPQVYRAVSVDEATQTLRNKYDNRIETLETHLRNTDVQNVAEDDQVQEVWSLTGHEAIESRTMELVDEAESEIALLVVDEGILSKALFDGLESAVDQDLSIILGGQTDAITDALGTELPNTRVFETRPRLAHRNRERQRGRDQSHSARRPRDAPDRLVLSDQRRQRERAGDLRPRPRERNRGASSPVSDRGIAPDQRSRGLNEFPIDTGRERSPTEPRGPTGTRAVDPTDPSPRRTAGRFGSQSPLRRRPEPSPRRSRVRSRRSRARRRPRASDSRPRG
ncbi:Sugar-specific transcriptional regulator TrmB [Natrinema salaciae]|uniref:Sugar-specific transcriptional regulator TrmB n=1 Tax=Natrinema salaciae TaxID=1186196 RepID=A0A1H9MID8_9EURY|nr:Sugar-specific transcriptional regulator TrmB [Natrinema salaciae]